MARSSTRLNSMSVSFPAANCTRASFKYPGRNKLPTTSLRYIWNSCLSQSNRSDVANGPEYTTEMRDTACRPGALYSGVGKHSQGCSPVLPQLKNQPALARTTQPPFSHISNRCNKKYELAQDNVLDYYLTASRRPRAKTGVTGPTAFKTFELGV